MESKCIKIFRQALEFGHPSYLIKNKVNVIDEGKISINNEIVDYDEKIKIIAFGKAAGSMTEAFLKIKNLNKIIEGIVILPDYSPKPKINHPNIEVFFSTHPYISKKSVIAGNKLLSFAKRCTKDETVFCLVSGGGSALVASPINEINVNQKIKLINLLLKLGIGEREVNVIRKKLSKIKGGSLAKEIHPARIINLILSDERSHQLEAIASGPSVENNSTITAKDIIIENNLWNHIPLNIHYIFKNNKIIKTKSKIKISSFIIGSREDLFVGLKKVSKKNNITYLNILPDFFDSNIDLLKKELLKKYNYFFQNAHKGTHLIIASGEVPIKVLSKDSKGGRNQHLAALMIKDLKKFNNFEFLAIASDGCDFINGVHGALISDRHISILENSSINTDNYINNWNSYLFHEKIGSLIKGPMTGTNINDCYMFYFQK